MTRVTKTDIEVTETPVDTIFKWTDDDMDAIRKMYKTTIKTSQKALSKSLSLEQ